MILKIKKLITSFFFVNLFLLSNLFLFSPELGNSSLRNVLAVAEDELNGREFFEGVRNFFFILKISFSFSKNFYRLIKFIKNQTKFTISVFFYLFFECNFIT
jgi:hypothetical protein